MSLSLAAAASALVYGGISWVVGDRFPFSRYAMYASLRGRTEGAVLVVRADGREVEFSEITAWSGVDPAAIEPYTVPCSTQWVVIEAQRWIATHTVVDPLPTVLEVGYRIVRVTREGFEERYEPRATGRGRLRE